MNREGYITKYGEEEGTRRWKQNERKKRWRQEHRKEHLEYKKRWRQEHCKEKAEYDKRWRQSHREERLKYWKQWYQTPYGRAYCLVGRYRRSDRQQNRGDCTLTAQWVVDKIFTKKCLYCGESDWRLLGCDRIDNTKAHTPGNVVCCCEKCNKKRQKMEFLKFAYSMGAKDSEGLIIE